MTKTKEDKTMLGRYRHGKIVYTTPRYNYLTGGNWKDGFSRVASSGGEETEYEIDNKEMIDESLPLKTYRFKLKKGKAFIVK
jgi:hypothetical protein